jgi:hypothetical protein
MSRSLPLFVLLGSLGASVVGSAEVGAEPTPKPSDVLKSPSSASPAEPPTHPAGTGIERPEGVVGDLNANKMKQEREAARANAKKKKTDAAIKENDKAKAVKSGNDATLRDLPSPAQKGSE